MAMSFSRPDPASPAQVADASFATGRRGFDQNEVRDFLRMVSAELGRLRERETFLERELREAQNNPDLDGARLDDEALTRLLGEETARVLNAARESSHEIREKAEQSAARMLLEASDEATRMREEAEIESSRRRADAAADAEAELSMAKQQGREMVTEARAYRERVLSELARRRELAREQIEQLVHGRDRLMQAFERARLVAVDVVSEMQPLGEPDEYVNLTPSTGPVPVMVARDAAATDSPPPGDIVDATASESAIPAHEPTADDLHVIEPAVDDADATDADDSDADLVEDPGADDPGSDTDLDIEAQVEVDESTDDEATDDEATDLVATEDEATDGGATHLEETDGDVDEDAVFAPVDTEDVPVADELDVVEETSGTDDSDDDVVVDLFARLRADATVEVEDDAGVFAVDADQAAPDEPQTPDSEAETETDVETVVDDAEVGDDERAEETVFDRRDADLTPLIVSSARKLKRVLADEQNEVLDALRRSDPVRNLDALLPWEADHTERYASVISDDLLLAANAGAALADLEKAPKLRKAAGKQAVAETSDKIGQWLVQPLRDRLERCVSEGDGDNGAITKKVRAVYRECKTRHIDEQLDDVIRAAHGQGLIAALAPDTAVEWTPDPSHEVCADCDDNRLAGAVASGQPFPTGQVCTPAHPGCRCMLVVLPR